MKKILPVFFLIIMAGCTGFQHSSKSNNSEIKLITLDPGHFHAALVQKPCIQMWTQSCMYTHRKAFTV